MVLQEADGQAGPLSTGRASQKLTQWQNVMRFALRPSDEHLTVPTDVLMVFEDDAITFEDADGRQVEGVELNGKTAALVLFEDSCYDLTLTLPAATLSEFEAMIRNEIAFASPFPEAESHSFWRANERADGTWDVHIGVVLKSEVARAQAAAAAQGVRLVRVVRLGEYETSSIYATPPWLTGVPALKAGLPKALRLPLAGLAIFALSVGVHLGLTQMETSTLRAEAAAADQTLRQAASAANFQRDITRITAQSRQTIALLALLSEVLPDDTWVDRITLAEGKVRMVAFGPSGAETVRLLSGVDGIENPQTIGTVTRDNTQNVERFVIEFTQTGTGG